MQRGRRLLGSACRLVGGLRGAVVGHLRLHAIPRCGHLCIAAQVLVVAVAADLCVKVIAGVIEGDLGGAGGGQ